MSEISRDFVSPKLARLLERCGYKEACVRQYAYDNAVIDGFIDPDIHCMGKGSVLCPTIQAVCRWLREEHFIHIMVDCLGRKNYLPTVQMTKSDVDKVINGNESKIGGNGFDTFEEAMETAILYCLTEIIGRKDGEDRKKAHEIGWENTKTYDPNLSKECWAEMAAIDMASWKEKQMVEKTIQWLATHAELYGGFNSGRLNDMVEAFKKDMENTKD